MRVTDTLRMFDGKTAAIEQYEAREQPGAPTGFAGTGYLVRVEGQVVYRHAWRVYALEYCAGKVRGDR